MGSQYVDDLNPWLAKIGDWEEYIRYAATNDTSLAFWQGEAEKIKIRQIKERYKWARYINHDLYRMAEDLSNRNSITNLFSEYFDPDKHTDTRADLAATFGPGWWNGAKNTGIKINNLKSIQWWLVDNLWKNPSKKKITTSSSDDDDLLFAEEESH